LHVEKDKYIKKFFASTYYSVLLKQVKYLVVTTLNLGYYYKILLVFGLFIYN